MTPEELAAGNLLNGSIEHVASIIAAFPAEAPDPVNLADVSALVLAIEELNPEGQADARIIDMIRTANLDYYNALKAAAEALKVTMEAEFTALGEEGE